MPKIDPIPFLSKYLGTHLADNRAIRSDQDNHILLLPTWHTLTQFPSTRFQKGVLLYCNIALVPVPHSREFNDDCAIIIVKFSVNVAQMAGELVKYARIIRVISWF